MKRQITVCLLCAALLGLCACAGGEPASSSISQPESAGSSSIASQPESPPISGVHADNFPRIDGSTANMPLIAQVYSTVCGVPLEEAQTMVEVSTTSPAWRNLVSGAADLLLVYEAAQDVQQEIESSGVALEVSPIGRDGLVFLVNTKNSVESLTQDQLRDIYSGKITDWSGVGGQPGEIAAFQRDAQSGSQTLFLKLLMKDIAPMVPPSELVPAFMGELIDYVSEYDGAGGSIGYSVYYYADQMYKNPNLKLLQVDGIAPTPETIGNASYPLIHDFYVVIRQDEPENSPARQLRDWLLTDAGRDVLVAAGYVPIN